MRWMLLAVSLFQGGLAAAADLPIGAVRDFTAQVLNARERARDVWPGFDLTKDPLLIHYPGKGTVLLGEGAPPQEFSRVGPSVYFKPGRFDLTFARFDVDVPLGGRSAFFFRHDEANMDRGEVELLVHEAFHKFQGTKRTPSDRSAFAALSRSEAGRTAYASHVENAALFQALASPDRCLEEARTFVALRRKRLSSMDSSLRTALLELETFEGSAEYVALRAGFKAPLDANAASTFLAPYLARTLFIFAELDAVAAERLDPSVYGSGPAQMLILDRLRAPWKERVAHGETIFSVMLDAVSTDDEAGRVKRAFDLWGDAGLEGALAVPRKGAASNPAELWAGFNRSNEPRVLLRIWDATASAELSFVGSALPLIGPGRSSLYSGIAEASLHTMDGLTVTFRQTSVRTGYGREQRRVGRMDQHPVEIEFLAPEPDQWRILADGKQFTVGTTTTNFRTLEWTSSHISLIASRPGSIVRADGRITIVIEPRR